MVATPAYSFDGNSSISVPTTTLDALAHRSLLIK